MRPDLDDLGVDLATHKTSVYEFLSMSTLFIENFPPLVRSQISDELATIDEEAWQRLKLRRASSFSIALEGSLRLVTRGRTGECLRVYAECGRIRRRFAGAAALCEQPVMHLPEVIEFVSCESRVCGFGG